MAREAAPDFAMAHLGKAWVFAVANDPGLLPGRTPDHFAVCAGPRGDQAVFTGDLIHSPIQARYPDLVMRVDYDQKQASAFACCQRNPARERFSLRLMRGWGE
jgi:hypothetical protein